MATALVVDDSASMRQMVTFTLKDAGFTVLSASNGKEALDQLNGQKIDIVVTDLNMPVMDGITFIGEARKISSYKFTPIIMLTTESQESKKQEGKSAGATGWIVKPFKPEELIDTVKRFVK